MFKKIFYTACFLSALILPTFISPAKVSAVSGTDYRAGNIISDEAMRNYNSMNQSAIQKFLKSKNSCNDTRTYIASWYPQVYYHIENGHFVCMADETFNGKSAAQIIYQAAQDYHINPQVLIVMLQKEQGLVTDTYPHNLQYRSATGYGCPDSSVCDTKYYGFENQIRNAAALFNTVMNGGWTNYSPGWHYIYYYPSAYCGGSNVYVENLATAALYRYTPYQPNQAALNAGYGTGDGCSTYGNRNFFLYFNDWFGSGTSSTSSSGSTTTAQPLSAGSFYVPDGTYQILTNTGRALDVTGASKNPGANVEIWQKHDGDNQKFRIARTSDGYYTITDVNSGNVLDVYNGDTAAGTNVITWPYHNACNQKWVIQHLSNSDRYVFRSACSGRALDVFGAHVSTYGANIDIWDYHGGTAQQFRLIALDDAPVRGGTYYFQSLNGNTVLDAAGGGTDNGTNLRIWEPNDTGAQKYKISRDKDGYYKIYNAASDKYVDVNGASAQVGANVQLWSGNTSCAQKWAVVPKDGHYAFLNACGGNALDIYGGTLDVSGTNVGVWNYHGGASELWDLVTKR